MPTRQAIVPALVPAQKLTNAISLNAGGNTITQIIGPAIAGILLGFTSPGIAFLAITILFGIATLSDLRLPKYGMVGNKKPKSFIDDLRGGAKYILGNRLVFLLLFANFLMPLFTFPLQQMMVIFVREVHGLSDAWLGYFLMILGVGSLIGIILMTSADRIKNKGYLLMFGGFVTGVAMLAFALTSNVIFALVMLGIVGLGEIIFGITNQAEIQRSITNEMRGRVMSVTMLSISVWPIAILPIGIATDAFGPGPTLSVTAVLFLGALVCLFGFSATLRKLYVDKRKHAELSHVQAAQLVAEGKITEDEASKLTGESD
jgi:predicted MFS family arabinose efflux permease